MKSTFLFFMLFGAMAFGSNQEVPGKVSKAFKVKHKAAKEVVWGSVEGMFQASFVHNDLQKVSVFDADGTWIRTVTTLSVEDLPECITDLLEETYSGAEVVTAEFEETPSSNEYTITIEEEEIEIDLEEEEEFETEGESDNENDPEYTLLTFDKNCLFLGEN